MKKNYLKPTTVVLELQHSIMLYASQVRNTDGNGGVNSGGSDAGVQNPILRSRQARFSDYEDDWE